MNDLHGKCSGAVNLANGALTELAKRGGAGWAQNAQVGGVANKAGHKLVHQASKLAPGAVVAAGAAVAAAPAVAVAVGAVAVGVGAVLLGKWIVEKVR